MEDFQIKGPDDEIGAKNFRSWAGFILLCPESTNENG